RNHFHHPFALKIERRCAGTTKQSGQAKQSVRYAKIFVPGCGECAGTWRLMNYHLRSGLTYKAAGMFLSVGFTLSGVSLPNGPSLKPIRAVAPTVHPGA
ncbi:MAG TPA: hypothetical protein VJW55_05235, partial [Candidatus Angelobacter sp.]|nr:hypothetical protein [Candidatus Angelobacter sp.]